MKSRYFPIIGSLLVSGLWSHSQTPSLSLPEIKTSYVLEGMPSFSQRSDAFDGGGKKFCGPTAASNALMWLADRGYPNLKPAAADDGLAQKEMIRRLATLMGTSREGTSAEGFRKGINSYLRTSGYPSEDWILSGNSPSGVSPSPPDLRLVHALASGKTVMWFSLGWYSFDGLRKKYSRDYGHLVTVVGYGENAEESGDREYFILADPASPNVQRYITFKMLSEGTISNGISLIDAKGYFNAVDLMDSAPGNPRKYCILESLQAMTIN